MIRFIVGLCAKAWRRIATPFQKPRRLRTVHLPESPETLKPGVVYVLGEGRHRWFVVLACPCGCGATVQMSLLPDAKPQWHLIEHADGTISLKPSVWRNVGCRSHFFLRQGTIQWCG